ncbi:MAG: hypothetical protein EBW21_03750, partial [Actinobacteria bacterium]|nr:hypothetical protein [Actinomycetota bacterium]
MPIRARARIGIYLIAALLIGLLGDSSSISATTVTVKNCVNIKSGFARLVSNSTTKCKSGERLVQIQVPALDVTDYSVVH